MKRHKWKTRIIGIIGILMAIVWLIPFYLMFTNAFKTKRDIFADTLGLPKAFTFENFTQAFEQLDFLRTLFNSLLISVVSVTLIIIFSSMAAYALSRNKSKISSFLFFIFVAAMLIPFQSVMIPLISQFGQFGMLNRAGLIFMYIGFGCSLSIFLYHGTLKGIPQTLDEAAKIDGANRFQIFWYIILPLLRPMTVTVGILNVIWIWNDYLLPSLVLGTADGAETIPLKLFYFFGQYTKQWHLALAGLTLSIIPVIIAYFFAQKQIIKGIADGAVK